MAAGLRCVPLGVQSTPARNAPCHSTKYTPVKWVNSQSLWYKIANKAAGIKKTQVTAQNCEEAVIIADQGVDMIITGNDWYPQVRK